MAISLSKNENRPKNLGNVKKDIYISNNLALEETLKELQNNIHN